MLCVLNIYKEEHKYIILDIYIYIYIYINIYNDIYMYNIYIIHI